MGQSPISKEGPTSASLCPACHKPIDALRAGQVAILDGAFRYFCDAKCKGEYVEVLSKRPALEALTPVSHVREGSQVSQVREGQPSRALPPGDARLEDSLAVPRSPIERAAPSRTLPYEEPREHEDFEEEPASFPEPPPSFPEPPASRRVVAESEPVLELSPKTLRSPKETQEEEERERKDVDGGGTAAPAGALVGQIGAGAPFVGILLGGLAVGVTLAGEAAAFTRLPLALAAATIVLARRGLGAREAGEPSPLVVVVPLLVSIGAAVTAAMLHHPHAVAHAGFVGIAAAAALVVDVLLVRARRDVAARRAAVRTALTVNARVVRGDGVLAEGGAHIKPGEQVVVEAGETIAVDGIVAAGDADVAPWLESPALLRKGEGDAVVAGAVVVSGRLRINTTFSGPERAWLRLAGGPATRVDVASPFVVLARRVVERGAPIAALVVAAAVYADHGSWLDVVVAASAAGLALGAFAAASASGLAHARGHAAAQRRGIVYKDAAAFDAAARADVAVLCSRGTVLLGEPEIVAVEPITKEGVATNAVWRSEPRLPSDFARTSQPPPSPEIARVLALAAGAEMSSSHPFASAVLREARRVAFVPRTFEARLVTPGSA